METYRPTLWRTCRVLSNAKRLRCLSTILAEPGLTVGETAARTNLPQNHASECLRALQARGLIAARRQSRWVRYFPEPDPLVPSARPLLLALTTALRKRHRPEADVTHLLTGFTHPRRLHILKCLKAEGPRDFDDLSRRTQISPQALYRHLGKLVARDLVHNDDAVWRLVRGSDELADSLILLASD